MSARIMAEARQQQEEVEAEGDPLRQAAAAAGGRWDASTSSCACVCAVIDARGCDYLTMDVQHLQWTCVRVWEAAL